MTFMDKVYTLRTEVRGDGKTAYFISFTDGQGEFYDLEVSEAFYIEFRQMERKNRNLQQSDWRHQEASDLWDETLYNRAFKVPKSVEELIFGAEQRELLNKAIAALPEIPILTAHELRHTYGTILRRKGMDIYTIQKVRISR